MLGDTSREPCDKASYHSDLDGDGFGGALSDCGDPDAVSLGGDCDDTDDLVHPAATETCNGTDDNCDGNVDEGLTTTIWYIDEDGDGHGQPGEGEDRCADPGPNYASQGDDCDDTNADVSPGAVDYCDGVDTSCSGTPDGYVATWYSADGTPTDVSASTGALALAGDGELALCEGLWTFRPSIEPSANVVIRGSGIVTLDAQSAGPALTIGADAIVQVDDIEILAGTSTTMGGNIRMDERATVTLTHVVMTSGSASQRGGGVYVASEGNLILVGASFGTNHAAEGGAIFLESSATITATDTLFSANDADEGGALYTAAATSTLTDCTFEANVASTGAGIAAAGGSVTLNRGNFLSNVAAENGGAMHLSDGAHLETDSTDFTDNAAREGGGLYVSDSSISLVGGSFTGGKASLRGGGISLSGVLASISGSTFANNVAEEGGGLYVTTSTATLTGTTLAANIAENGGGLGMEASTVTMTGGGGSSVDGNEASDLGGAFYVVGDSFAATTLALDGVQVLGNSAAEGGGVVVYGDASLLITGGTLFSGSNTATGHGGGLALGALLDLYSGAASCTDSKFEGNEPEDVYAALSSTGGTFSGVSCTPSSIDLAVLGSQPVTGDFICTYSGCL